MTFWSGNTIGWSTECWEILIKYNKIYIITAFTLLGTIYCSCGASKRNIEKNEKALEIEYNIKRTDKSRIETNVLTTKTATETIFEPIDSAKPIIVGKDTIHNAKVVTRHVKTDSVSSVQENKDVVELDNSKVSVEEKEKKVDVEREGFSWQGLKSALIWIAIILVLGIVFWITYRMRKDGD